MFQFLGIELPVTGVALGLMSGGLWLRAPRWPRQGWFTRLAEESPSSVIVSMSAVTVPVTTYVFVRLAYALFPQTVAQAGPVIVVIGAVNLIVGGICAAAQRGLRLLLAYLCMSQIGIILLGIGSLSSAGVVGAIYGEFALGLGLAGFGLFAGIVFDRTGRGRFLNDDGEAELGGVATQAPIMAVIAGIVIGSLLTIPGLAGFVGSALVLLGSFPVYPIIAILATGSLLLATYYLFMMYRHVFLGRASEQAQAFTDLTLRERAYLLPLVACLLVFGLYPTPLIELVRPTVLTLLSTVK
jgi:NADH-quinone oxidoreductase subunit M